MIKLRQDGVLDVAQADVFKDVASYDALNKAICKHGLNGGIIGSELYNDRIGAAFEVFAEFFLKRLRCPCISNHKHLRKNRLWCILGKNPQLPKRP